MKAFISLLISTMAISGLMAQNPQFVSAEFISTSTAYILDVETDEAGNTYSAGYFYGDLNFPQGKITNTGTSIGNGFIYKKNSSGGYEWIKHLEGEGKITAIYKASGNAVYIAGVIRNAAVFNGTTYTSKGTMDAFIARLNSLGNTTWFKLLEGTSDGGYNSIGINDIVSDESDNIYFTGYFTDSVKYGNKTFTASGVNDIMLGKVSPAGNIIWFNRAGGTYSGNCGLPNNDNGAAIALDHSNGVYITGHYAFNLQIGTQNFTSNHDVDVYLARYDRDGNFIWARSEGGLSWDVATSVTCDNANNVYMAGYFQETMNISGTTYTAVSAWGSQYDIFIAKYNSNGDPLWSKQEGKGYSEQVTKIQTDYDDNLYIGGTLDGETKIADSLLTGTPKQSFIAKYKSNGTPVYLAHGGGYRNFLYAFDLDRNNDVFLGGFAEANPWQAATFGPFSATATNNYIFNALLDDPFNSTFSINEAESNLISTVYPNPAETFVIIEWGEEPAVISLFDITGKLVLNENPKTGFIRLNTTGLAPGIYIYRVTTNNNGVSAGKIVVR